LEISPGNLGAFLSVFENVGAIAIDPNGASMNSSGLTGKIAEQVTTEPAPDSETVDWTFELPEIESGDYILVLGASPDMGEDPATSQGKMYLSKNGGGSYAATTETATPVWLEFADGAVSIAFTDSFASNAWSINEILAFNH
jgi:hypothetical protein